MQSSAVDEIRQAEQRAEEMLERASQEACASRRGAREAADAARVARLAADSIVETTMEQARRQVEASRSEAQGQLERELDEITALAAQRRAAAVGRILRLIGER